MNTLAQIFTAHPAKVNETYFQHMGVAAYFFFWLLVASFCALVHAIIPAMFETTASRIVRKLYARMENRH